jgi:hypothetical protein
VGNNQAVANKQTGGSNRASLYVLAILFVLGGAAGWYLNRGSTAAQSDPLTPEGKAYVENLRLSDVGMKATESYVGQTIVEIEGKIGNVGTRSLDQVEVYCIFYDSYGQLVLRKRLAIVASNKGGPLQPGGSRAFRLPFDDLPPSWNNAMPHLVIASVKFS